MDEEIKDKKIIERDEVKELDDKPVEVIKERNGGGRVNNKKQKDGTKSYVGLILGFSMLLSFICGMLGAYLISKTVSVEQVVKNITTSELIENSISSSVDKVWYSTVVIAAYKNEKQISTGTGFVYKKSGKLAYILTNNHVIESADSVKVEFNDSNKKIDAKIIGGDAHADIAVLSIPDSEDYKVVEIGDNADLKLGDTIFTVGSPMGIGYKGTVTKGILSGKDRMVDVTVTNNNNSKADYYMKVIQIDAAVNPGNSGGPLCDVSGKVIGIISIKIVQDAVEGMGFAIPIEDALKYASIIENGGKITRPYLGITMSELDQEYYLWQNKIMVPENVDEGVVVVSVDDDSAASKGGLKKGDIIFTIGGNKVNSIAEFRYELYRHEVGEKVEFEYYRDGKVQKSTITLGKQK